MLLPTRSASLPLPSLVSFHPPIRSPQTQQREQSVGLLSQPSFPARRALFGRRGLANVCSAGSFPVTVVLCLGQVCAGPSGALPTTVLTVFCWEFRASTPLLLPEGPGLVDGDGLHTRPRFLSF